MYNYNKIQRLWTQKKRTKIKKKKDHKKEETKQTNKINPKTGQI